MKKKILIFAMFLLVFTVLTGCVKEQKTANNEQKIEESAKSEENKAEEIEKEEDIVQELEEIDELGRKTYRDKEYGFEFKYSSRYPLEDKTSMFKNTDDFPWYAQPLFMLKYVQVQVMLKYVQVQDYNVNSKNYIYFKILNTIDEEKIKTSGGWEFIERIKDEKIGTNDYQVFKIDKGNQGIKVIIKDGKAFAFFGYLEDVEFNKILETFKFIK